MILSKVYFLLKIYCFRIQYTLIQASMHSGVGNGNPLQYSCLENPIDGGAW